MANHCLFFMILANFTNSRTKINTCQNQIVSRKGTASSNHAARQHPLWHPVLADHIVTRHWHPLRVEQECHKNSTPFQEVKESRTHVHKWLFAMEKVLIMAFRLEPDGRNRFKGAAGPGCCCDCVACQVLMVTTTHTTTFALLNHKGLNPMKLYPSQC